MSRVQFPLGAPFQPPTHREEDTKMSYHDHGYYKTKWSSFKEEEADQMKEQTKNPSIQVVSPIKKLHDIQQIINSLPNKHMTTYELQDAIQRILDGE